MLLKSLNLIFERLLYISVSAFANGKGGVLFLGVADDETLVGLTDPRRVSEKISEIIKIRMEPISQTDMEFHEENGVAGIIILTHRWEERGKLTTLFLDVGQGDGIFMRQYKVEPFLKSQGVGGLDYVLISHDDSDHMNSVGELMERQNIGVKIKTLVLPV